MDVKAILNNLSYLNQNSSSISQQKNQVDNIEVSSIPKGNEGQDKTKDNSNKSNDNQDLNKALDTLNKFLEKEKTHAEFSVYKNLGRTMIKVIDDKTDEVLMEFPQEKILDAVTCMLENAGLLDEKA